MNINLKIQIVQRFRTQADFAMAVDEHESLVSRVIHGRLVLPEKKQFVWAKTLGADRDALFGKRDS